MDNRFYIGCHLSTSGGYSGMARDALSIGANVFQYFTRNPRGGAAKTMDPADVAEYIDIAKKNEFGPPLAHASYTINPCSKDLRVREFALETMADDMARLQHIPSAMYNFHPGSHVGQGVDDGITLICGVLNAILKPEHKTIVLLETMSGKGSEIGGTFEELRRIIDGVELKDKIGVCMDTCHMSDAGYDIIGDLDGVLDMFDRIVGLDRVKAMHVNDSKNPPSSHKDRHEKIGEGTLGIEVLARIINHPKLRDLPFYLETPNELDGYAEEIALLKKLRN